MNSSEISSRISEFTIGRNPRERRDIMILLAGGQVVMLRRVGTGWELSTEGDCWRLVGGWGRHVRVSDRSWRDGTPALISVGDLIGSEFRERAYVEVRPCDIVSIGEVRI